MGPLVGRMGQAERAHLARAKRRIDRLDLYPTPVRMRHVRIVHTPWLFRIPGFRRFVGYECGPLILVKKPVAETTNDLVTHELCHVWQDQHRRAAMWLSYVWEGYRDNRHEVEARFAAAATRDVA
jgi:hypothetical protein